MSCTHCKWQKSATWMVYSSRLWRDNVWSFLCIISYKCLQDHLLSNGCSLFATYFVFTTKQFNEILKKLSLKRLKTLFCTDAQYEKNLYLWSIFCTSLCTYCFVGWLYSHSNMRLLVHFRMQWLCKMHDIMEIAIKKFSNYSLH